MKEKFLVSFIFSCETPSHNLCACLSTTDKNFRPRILFELGSHKFITEFWQHPHFLQYLLISLLHHLSRVVFITEANLAFREGNGSPLHCSCLENPMDGTAWWATVHEVTKSRTRSSDFTFTFHFHALEKEMATHSSVLSWRIPGTGEPGGLPSMELHTVRHDWRDLAAAAA